MEKFDLVIIGAGPAGYFAAIEAVKFSMKVCIVEKGTLGGTCLNRGCIPTKTLLYSSNLLNSFKNSEEFGVYKEDLSYSIEKIYSRKDQIVERIRTNMRTSLERKNIKLFLGIGTIISENEVMIKSNNEETVIKTGKILIATGSKSKQITFENIKDTNKIFTSDKLMFSSGEKAYIPKSLLIIGGGVIAAEFASFFSAFGTKISVVETSKNILSFLDKSTSSNLEFILRKKGVDIFTSSKIKEVTQNEEDLKVLIENDDNEIIEVFCENILVSVGRKENIENLFAEGFSVETNNGGILVDENFRTSNKNIYAVGDVIYSPLKLASLALSQGINAVLNMNSQEKLFNLETCPGCIYTNPEVAFVGLNEKTAKAKGYNVEVKEITMNSNARNIITNQQRSIMRLISDKENKRILGAQLVCSRASEMIGEFTTAINNNLKVADINKTLRPHPTFNESLIDMFI